MRKTIFTIAVTALVLTGCARPVATTKNDAAKEFFDSWIKINHPRAEQTPLGSYIIDSREGTGKALGTSEEHPFVRMNYTIRKLDGTISNSTYPKIAQQLGTYDKTKFYGPEIVGRGENVMTAGLDEIIGMMREGGMIEAAVPGWLDSQKKYSTAQEYLENVTGTDYVYTLELVEAISDIQKWETDSLVRFLQQNYPEVNPADTVTAEGNHKKYGFYYIQEKATDLPDSTYKEDTKVYFNYTGRLLNGQIFDTTNERTAKDAGIYSAGRSYKPTYITWKDDYDQIKMGSSDSDTIDGFKYALAGMKPHEKGIAIFLSKYGYSTNGSGDKIPAYSPLIFELELVDSE